MELYMTVDEIVETLKRSSLTTILVEGKDDMMIYRWIEQDIGIENANFMSCGGRDTLLKVFSRRNEFNQTKTIFIADKDSYVYETTPETYKDVIWTNGYSIENDLYYGRKIENLLDINEDVKFRKSLIEYTTYYAFEVEQFNKRLVYNFANHPSQILDDSHNLRPDFLTKVNFAQPQKETIDYLQKHYDVLLRGKSLFALLIRFLSSKKRSVKHSKKSLLEHCYKMEKSKKIEELIGRIEEKLYA